MRTIGSTTRTRAIAKAARWRRWQGNGESKVAPRTAIVPRMLRDTFLDSGRVFGYNPQMKTQIIEIDHDTAMALKQRAAERGLSVPELVAELVTLEAGPADADVDDIVELDRRWKAFEAQGSVAANDDVVRWLQTWGTPAFRSWRNR
jgi:predicted transcriptional regulator